MGIYLDHAATTPLRAEVLEAMTPYLTTHFGNASSPHAFGRAAREGLDRARETVGSVLGAKPREIVFTSGGSEADNLAIKGAAWAASARGRHLVTSAVEHHAVLATFAHLERFGFTVTYLEVDRFGRVDPEQLAASLTDHTTLVSIGYANGEIGTVQPIAEIGAICRAAGVLFHTDAIQAAGHLDLDVDRLGVDLLSLAAHKFEGPKGVGALFIRQGTAVLPQQQGGSQERQRRAGTEDVAGAVGLAEALRLAQGDPTAREAEEGRLRRLSVGLYTRFGALGDGERTGHPRERLPGLASWRFDDLVGDDLVAAADLDGLAVSTGSACTSGSAEPSHVLLALGLTPDQARGSLRISLGRTTTTAEVEQAGDILAAAVERLRAGATSPVTEAMPAPAGA